MSISEVVRNNLCTGCGVCVSEDETGDSYMVWNEDGFVVPKIKENSDTVNMYKVCPFNLESPLNEDALAEDFLTTAKYHDPDIGSYSSLYAGYSKSHRNSSSSGGLATYMFEQLLKNKIVEHLFIVKDFDGKYAYQLFSSATEIKQISKTRYFPVTMENLFKVIDGLEGKVAISGVACFLKAIRLKQYHQPKLREKIPFLIGIICGGLKSSYYTDFLAQSAGCNDEYHSAQYRIKNENSFALDYKFSCTDNATNKVHDVKMLTLGDMWGTGLFKSNACDFCDDVTTELADISLGDAWIPPYNKDGLGNSIVITRSKMANYLINRGIENGDLRLDEVDLDSIKRSQSGSFNHRHKGLSFRMKYQRFTGGVYPIKRERFIKSQGPLFNLIQIERMLTRSKSILIWKEEKQLKNFRKKIYPYLFILRKTTGINHKLINIKSTILKKIGKC